jgi:hypothetical protein
MKKWILTNQTLIALIIGGCSVLIVFLIDFRGPVALAAFILSIVLIAVGSWLFESDTSENWLGDLLRANDLECRRNDLTFFRMDDSTSVRSGDGDSGGFTENWLALFGYRLRR